MNAPTNALRTSPSRRLGLLLAALIAALLAAFALVSMATQNAQAQETKTFPVQAKVRGWQDTGMYIRQGDRLVIDGDGTVNLGPAADYPQLQGIKPGGLDDSVWAPDATFLAPNLNVGALIGQIGSGDPFMVGSLKEFSSVASSGELRLAVNDADTAEAYADNSGEFTADIMVYPPSAPTDTKHPRVVRTVPAAGAKGVAPTDNIRAFFSEDMKANTINGSTFKLFREGSSTKVDASVAYKRSMDKAVLNPDKALRSGVTYKAVVTTHAKDQAGNRLDQRRGLSGLQPKVWHFKVSD